MIELKCSKCPEEDHEGHFCRCEDRNIHIGKELRLRGMSPWNDKVNHPSHYQGKGFEVIDIIEDFGLNFHLGNAIKYILRAGKKGNRTQDIQKAIWYLTRELGNEDEEDNRATDQ